MVVGFAAFELHIPEARSLKDKRRVVKSLCERVHARYRVSITETGFHDVHQRAEVGVALVARRESEARNLLAEIRRMADSEPAAFLTRWDEDCIEDGDG